MLQLIEDYKKHIAKTELKDEVYKWELVANYQGRPDLYAADFLAEIKSIPYGNLLYQLSTSSLVDLVNSKPDEMRLCFKMLFDEKLSLVVRTKTFIARCADLYQGFDEGRKHNQDERSISTYLSIQYPKKYTFYKYSFYKKMCDLLKIKGAIKNERYAHYLELIQQFIEDYIDCDIELINQVKSYIPQYYDGTNNLILAQDILYQMMDKNQKSLSVATQEENSTISQLKNVKVEFINWMIEDDKRRPYFSKQFNSNRNRFELEINEYEEVYKKNFNSDLFVVDIGHIANYIERIKSNIYDRGSEFSIYNIEKANRRPSAILGKKNYLQFLSNYSMNVIVPQISNLTNISYPLNQILYGPPGTGKTYHTVLEAAKIVSGNENISYDEALDIFNENLGGQIEFITFHQNYSYEDFIQGLRPDTENGSALTFEKKDGVFKRIADRALKNIEASKNPAIAKKDFDLVFQELLKPLNEGDILELEIKMKKSSFFITEVGLKSIEFRKNIGESNHTLSINTLRKMYERGVNDLILGGLQPYYNPILEILLEKGKSNVQAIAEENFVIIIDEINRANISRVFGELITLIEEDKRSHGKIPMRVTLPSGDSFIVPSNLYIIGTMNTADKSIALLDIALRRRFEFIPMYPNLEVKGINDVLVLEAINKAILDRKNHDFTIGHSYFMADSYSREKTINNKVIPLLLEYFMNDEKEVIAILNQANLKVGNWPLKLISEND